MKIINGKYFLILKIFLLKYNYNRAPFGDEKHLAAVILARGGSKGIKLKNLAQVNNKSILNLSLETIKTVKEFKSIWVSTDHYLIAEESSKGNKNN